MIIDDFRLTSAQYSRLSMIKLSKDKGMKTEKGIDTLLKDRKLVSSESGITYVTQYALKYWSIIRIK